MNVLDRRTSHHIGQLIAELALFTNSFYTPDSKAHGWGTISRKISEKRRFNASKASDFILEANLLNFLPSGQ